MKICHMAVTNCKELILLLSIIALFPPHVLMADEVIFYATNHEDTTLIAKSIASSLDRYREELGLVMTRMDNIFRATDEWDNNLDNIFADTHSEWRNVIQSIPNLHEKNEIVAHMLLCNKTPRLTLALLNQPSIAYFPYLPTQVSSSYTSTQQLLIHLLRDWGDHGEKVRESTYYKGVLEALDGYLHFLTCGADHPLHVLVPGAGMGRLAMEIAASGKEFV